MPNKTISIPALAFWIALGLTQLACAAVLTPTPEPAITVVPVIVRITATPDIRVIEVTAVPTPTPASPEELTDEQIKAGIQTALDNYSRAYNENYPELFTLAVDQTNRPFRRILRARFDAFQQSSLAGEIEFAYTVQNIEHRDMGFVLAHITVRRFGAAAWLFRLEEGRWVISEPTVEQIGDPVTVETEHFTFITYPWADDVNPAMMQLMDDARANVLNILGVVPDQKARVELMPIYGLQPLSPMTAAALYRADGADGADLIRIYTPHSFAFGEYSGENEWSGHLGIVLTHEYTHMTHARSFDGAGRMADWMSEGLAEYVANTTYDLPDNLVVACQAAGAGLTIPIVDPESATDPQDLMHLRSLRRNLGLGYGLSHALVAYIVEEGGGLESFWALANALDEVSDFDQALQQALEMDYEQFEATWRMWLETQC